MAALISFGGRTIIDDSPSAAATAFASGGLYGVAKLLSTQTNSVRAEMVPFAGAAGMRVKILGVRDSERTARIRVLGGEMNRPARVFHSTRANLLTWLYSVESFYSNPANRIGTLVFNGETLNNMYLQEFQWSPPIARFGFAPGGVTKGFACDLTATWIEVL